MRAYRCLAVAAVICLACPAFGQAANDEPLTFPEPTQELDPAAPDQPAGGPPAEQGAPPVEILWQRQFGTRKDDHATDLALDAEGNCYVVGGTYGSFVGKKHSNPDAFVAKYGSDGTLLWMHQFGTGTLDSAGGVAVDTEGNCFVAGTTWGRLGDRSSGSVDVFLLKYDSGGTLLWKTQFGSGGGEMPFAITADSEGNCYITGYTGGDLASPRQGDQDVFIAKYDGNGNELWVTQFGTDGRTHARAIAVAEDGIIYVAGWTEGDMGGENHGEKDAFVLMCDSDGQWLWADQIGTTDKEEACGVVLDAEGNAYVSGSVKLQAFIENSDTPGIFLTKYDVNGVRQWSTEAGRASLDRVSRSVMGRDGYVYLAGSTWGWDTTTAASGEGSETLTKYDTDGQRVWHHQFNPDHSMFITAVAVDTEGTCYLAGWTGMALAGEHHGEDDAFIMVLSPTAAAPANETSDDVPRDGPDDAPDDDAPADDPPSNSWAE